MSMAAQMVREVRGRDPRAIARAVSGVENSEPWSDELLALVGPVADDTLVVGVTGPPGVGKSTLVSRLVSCWREQEKRVGVVAVDPSSPFTGGAVLGDRVRMMEHALDPDVVIRSMSSRGRLGGLSAAAAGAVRIMAAAGCRRILVETVGVGQSEMDVTRLADVTMLVLAPGMGDAVQALKAGLVEAADLLVINKADYDGAHVLARQMESDAVFPRSLVMTVAVTGQGVDQLLQTIDRVAEGLARSGAREKRRHQAWATETMDRLVQLLEPHLRKTLEEEAGRLPAEPGSAARALFERLRLPRP